MQRGQLVRRGVLPSGLGRVPPGVSTALRRTSMGAQFTTNSLTTLLGGGGNITAIDGNSYAKADYFGTPNPPAGRNTGEPYGYITLLLRGASVNFRTIVVRLGVRIAVDRRDV